MRRMILVAMGIVCFWASGCASGQKINYLDAKPDLSIAGNMSVAVATLDQRQNSENDTYVGRMRGGFPIPQIPYSVTTASMNPLSDDMTRVMVTALAAKGFKATAVSSWKIKDQTVLLEQLKASLASRLILLNLRVWYSDTYARTALVYDVILTVYDGSGRTLGEKEIKGKDNLGGFGEFSTTRYAKEEVPKALAKKLEELFLAPEISENLRAKEL